MTPSCPLYWISLFSNYSCQNCAVTTSCFEDLKSYLAKLTYLIITSLSKSFILYQCCCFFYSQDAEVFPQPEVTDWAEASPDPDIVKETVDE